MTVTAWRIVQAHLAPCAFDGEGARLYAGRWNLAGTRLVYCSGSLSLATLEIVVNLDSSATLHEYVSMPVRFSSALCTRLGADELPEDWNHKPPSRSAQIIGSRWVQSSSSLVLAVPSVVVPSETNYLINPSHPAFSELEIGDPSPFELDSRLTS